MHHASGLTKKSDLFLANCFCPSGWTQLKDLFDDTEYYYGECIRMSSSSRDWFDASRACADRNAFLVSEFSELKHNFNVDYARSVYGQVVPYYIGLYYDVAAGEYLWEEKTANDSRIPVRYHFLK